LRGDPVDFASVLDQVASFFEGLGFRYAIVGAFGLHAYGLVRATGDLDFVVEERARAHLLTFLDSLGYERLHVSEGYSNHVHRFDHLGRLDFIYVDERTADALFRGAKRMPLFRGKEVLVPSPEHLAAMKVLAMKNDPSRTFQELADIQFLLGLPGVDQERIRGYFEKHGMLEMFDEIKRRMPPAGP
jgi:hypothetical protein